MTIRQEDNQNKRIHNWTKIHKYNNTERTKRPKPQKDTIRHKKAKRQKNQLRKRQKYKRTKYT